MPTTSFEWYWTHIGIAMLIIIGTVSLFGTWRRILNDNSKEAILGENGAAIKKAIIFTGLFIGSIGMLFMGFGPTASTTNTTLEGETETISRQALEAELRNKDQIIFQTRAELEATRQGIKALKKDLENKLFESDIKVGQERMNTTRNRIMNRKKGD